MKATYSNTTETLATLPASSLGQTRNGATASPENSKKQEDQDRHLVQCLQESKTFRDFAQSFRTVTGLPLTLRPRQSWNLPLHGTPHEGTFCQAIAKAKHGCGACLQVQEDLNQDAENDAKSVACRECPFGLVDSVVPIRTEGRIIGYLQTGQVAIRPVKKANLKKAADLLAKQGIDIDVNHLEDAYLQTRYVEPEKYKGMVSLLNFMAEHLGNISNQLAIRQQNAEPVFISKARQYIEENLTEELPLARVAEAVHTSSFYFCKMFKKVTGLNFTHYVSRVRVERAKTMLQNPNLRVSEIAFEVGFQSLTHFNRVFRQLTGVSPSAFRNSAA